MTHNLLLISFSSECLGCTRTNTEKIGYRLAPDSSGFTFRDVNICTGRVPSQSQWIIIYDSLVLGTLFVGKCEIATFVDNRCYLRDYLDNIGWFTGGIAPEINHADDCLSSWECSNICFLFCMQFDRCRTLK